MNREKKDVTQLKDKRNKRFFIYTRFLTLEEKQAAHKVFALVAKSKNIIEISEDLLNYLNSKDIVR